MIINKLKLCFIADANSIHTYRWLDPFIQQNHQVYLLSYKPVQRVWDGLEALIDLTELINVDKVRFAYWGWWVNRYVRQIKPDILHAHQIPGAGWLGVMANYHPFIVTAWGSDILVEPHKSIFRSLLLKSVLNRCDQLTLPSKLMYNAAQEIGVPDNKLNLIPWGLETDIFKPLLSDRKIICASLGIPTDTQIIFSPRGISRLYNIDILIKTFKEISSKQGNIHLILIKYNVDEAYLAELKQIIRDYDLETSIQWLSPQETLADMSQLYNVADVVVSIPSSEGYGFTVYEAMACGCPTIISDLPIFESELLDGVHTMKVLPHNISQLSSVLLQVLNDKNLHQQLREGGLKVCRNKSVLYQVSATKSLYIKMAKS